MFQLTKAKNKTPDVYVFVFQFERSAQNTLCSKDM